MTSFKWGEVTYIWTQKWGEGRLNGKMNGGRIVGKAEKLIFVFKTQDLYIKFVLFCIQTG